MQYNMIVYLLFLCGFLDSAMAKIFDIPSSAFTMMQTNTKGLMNFIPMANFSVPKMIQKEGYPVETHTVQTKDGYLLSLYRIPGKKGSPPVLMVHGLLGSSADWIILGKNNSLGYLLADQGYDVWLGNLRGNTYSRAHVSLSPSDSRFWNFSFHEMGKYDLPAMISYITKNTSQPLYAYIGFSMGTTSFYVMGTEYPEIARKIKITISLAPGAFLQHMTSPIRYLTLDHIAEDLKASYHLIGEDEVLPHNALVYGVSKSLCATRPQAEVCFQIFIHLIFCLDRDQLNMTLWPTLMKYYPAGISAKTLVHYAQLIRSGKFRQYDYGPTENKKMYNTSEPPEYNLTKITTPVAFFYGKNDCLTTVEDEEHLISKFPNVICKYLVPFDKFGHLDFILAKNVRELVYEKVLKTLNIKSC